MNFPRKNSIHYAILAVSAVISAISSTTYAGVALIQYQHTEAKEHQIPDDNALEFSVSQEHLPDAIIDLAKAVALARAQHRGKVLEAALSEKQGRLFYFIEFNDHGKASVIWVDALSGDVIPYNS